MEYELDPLPSAFPAGTDIVPFTIKWGPGLLGMIEQMRHWLDHTLIPYINSNLSGLLEADKAEHDRLILEWNLAVATLTARVEEAESNMGDSVELAEAARDAAKASADLAALYASEAQGVQDASVNSIISNTSSVTRTTLDDLYLAATVFDGFRDTVETQLASLTTAVSSKAEQAALTTLSDSTDSRFAVATAAIAELVSTKADKSEVSALAGYVTDLDAYVDERSLIEQTTETSLSVGSRRVQSVTGIHSAFPSHVRLSDGRLFMVYRESTTEQPVNMDGVIKAAYSSDGGNTWTVPVTILTDVLDLRDPNVTDVDGRLYLTTFKHNGSQPLGVFLSYSDDMGVTWSTLSRIDSANAQRSAVSAPLVKVGNFMYVPFYGKSVLSETYDTAWVLRSSDGVTWTQYTIAVGSGRDYQEPNIAEVDGNLIAMFRYGNTANMGRAQSANNGQTWSAVTSVVSGASGKPALIVVKSMLIMLYRRVADGRPIIRVSRDAGVSWGSVTVLDNENVLAMAYGSMYEIAPGLISVVYSLETAMGGPGVNGGSKLYIRYVFINSGTSPLGDVAPPLARSFSTRKPPIVFDDFERPDNAASVGIADSGHPWTATGMGVSAGSMYTVATAVNIATVDSGVSDGEIECEFNYTGNSGGVGIVARMASDNTYLMFVHDTEGRYARLYKVVGGTATQLAQGVDGSTDPRCAVFAYTPFKLKVKMTRYTIRCYVDDYEVLAYTLAGGDATTFEGKTRHGVRMNRAGATVHSLYNFMVTA